MENSTETAAQGMAENSGNTGDMAATQTAAAQPAANYAAQGAAQAGTVSAAGVAAAQPQAAVQMMAPPTQAPAPLYPQYLTQQLPQTVNPASEALTAGVMGLIIVGTGAMGKNLHRVNDGEMKLSSALSDSVAKGAVGATAAAGATYAASTLTTGGLFGLAVTLAAGTGISYLLTK